MGTSTKIRNGSPTPQQCAVYGTEHGSDHRAIETVFDTLIPVPKQQDRLLLKNAPWKKINTRIARELDPTPSGGTVQQQTDRLMAAVLEAVHALTPKARPSPYAKPFRYVPFLQAEKVRI